eukprot:3252206-Prymnesium_polylepis.1
MPLVELERRVTDAERRGTDAEGLPMDLETLPMDLENLVMAIETASAPLGVSAETSTELQQPSRLADFDGAEPQLGDGGHARQPILYPRPASERQLFVQIGLDQVGRCRCEHAIERAAASGRVVLVRHYKVQLCMHCLAYLSCQLHTWEADKGVNVEIEQEVCRLADPFEDGRHIVGECNCGKRRPQLLCGAGVGTTVVEHNWGTEGELLAQQLARDVQLQRLLPPLVLWALPERVLSDRLEPVGRPCMLVSREQAELMGWFQLRAPRTLRSVRIARKRSHDSSWKSSRRCHTMGSCPSSTSAARLIFSLATVGASAGRSNQ